MQPLLEVKNLKKHFPLFSGLFRRQTSFIEAVSGVDFTLHSGKILGLVGESGSGKSTIAKTAIRLIEPTSGDSLYLGQSIYQMKGAELKRFRKEVQIVFQDPYASLNPRKTVFENIGEALFYHEIVSSNEEAEDYIAHLLKQVGMQKEAMRRYPHEFSGGQQQRICIGRALSLKPKLIVCDEAVSALDVSIQAQVLNLLLDLKEEFNLSYLFISHDLSVVRYLCDEALVLYRGKVVERGTPEELFSNPQAAYTQKLANSILP